MSSKFLKWLHKDTKKSEQPEPKKFTFNEMFDGSEVPILQWRQDALDLAAGKDLDRGYMFYRHWDPFSYKYRFKRELSYFFRAAPITCDLMVMPDNRWDPLWYAWRKHIATELNSINDYKEGGLREMLDLGLLETFPHLKDYVYTCLNPFKGVDALSTHETYYFASYLIIFRELKGFKAPFLGDLFRWHESPDFKLRTYIKFIKIRELPMDKRVPEYQFDSYFRLCNVTDGFFKFSVWFTTLIGICLFNEHIETVPFLPHVSRYIFP